MCIPPGMLYRLSSLCFLDIKPCFQALLFSLEEIAVLQHPDYQKKHYIIRLKSNARLQSMAQSIADEKLDGTRLDERQVYYAEFQYQSKSWDTPRRVVVKMEKPAGEL
jgi:hypothetical protein